MTAPISKIGGSRTITRDAGSDGHAQVAKKLDIDPRTGRPMNAKVMDVAKMYERQFLGEMFKAMRSTVSETDKPSMAQNIYNSQRDEQYIDAWSEQGGVGFSNIIYDQIMQRYFGQTEQGQALKKQGPIQLTNRPIANVSQVRNGVATPVTPKSAPASAPAPVQSAASVEPRTVNGEQRTVENTEPMPAPTPAKEDSRSTDERVAAGEYFPASATAKDSGMLPGTFEKQTALQIEVRPSPTGEPAKIQAPWDATVVRATKLDGQRTAVILEHGQGLRSTLVFDGVLSTNATPGQKIPRGDSIATLNHDAKSFLWNLAPQQPPASQTASQIE